VVDSDISIYIHWPFCISKCPYCDFNSHVRQKHHPKEWTEAIEQELVNYAKMLPHKKKVKTIFFGGGTPSLIPPFLVEAIIKKIFDLWKPNEEVEITLEANPTSSEAGKFRDLVNAGVNRFSLGIQSLQEKDLLFLGRNHSVKEALIALNSAQKYARRVSFDLIYARPKQTLKEWEKELEFALTLGTKHLSLYQLTIEPGTVFYTKYKAGKIQIPEHNLAADFYTLTESLMEKEGILPYEISNYALPGQECLHNQVYWSYGEYLGLGPGAHGRFKLDSSDSTLYVATQNHRAPEIWFDRVKKFHQGQKHKEVISKKEQITEMLMMGLRTVKGVSIQRISFLSKNFWEKVDTLCQEGYLVKTENSIYPTLQGRLCLNSVLSYLIEAIS